MTQTKSGEISATAGLIRYNRQCIICNKPVDEIRRIHDQRFVEGLSFNKIGAQIGLSADAVGNHLNHHAVRANLVPNPSLVHSGDAFFDGSVPSAGDLPNITSGTFVWQGTQPAPLTGVVAPPPKPPKGWEPRVELDGDTGYLVSTPQRNDQISDFSEILVEMGLDPEAFRVVGPARISKWQQRNDGEWLTSYRVSVEKNVGEDIDLPALVQEVKAQIRYVEDKPQVERNPDRTLVVPFADLQVGKVGSRGDSEALIERLLDKRDKLADYIDEQRCADAIFLDLGDVIEGFENTAQQSFTNDLTPMQQLDLAITIEQDFIALLAGTHDRVTVGGVPSNHAAWRKGKDYLGRPADDWGLFALKQIERVYSQFEGTYDHVDFVYPEEWEKALYLEAQGMGIGVVHGDESSLAQMENYWAKHVHGASALAKADILLTGHYHTFKVGSSGRSLRTGKQKYWIAAPTLDNGSDWWANKTGSDSDPGLVVFVVDKEKGFDLQSLDVL
jgi:hypothetical protein